MSVVARKKIDPNELPNIYPGVVADFQALGQMREIINHRTYGSDISNIYYAFMKPFSCCVGIPSVIIDMPFSFILDTILLPTDLVFKPGAIMNEKSKSRSFEPKEIVDCQNSN